MWNGVPPPRLACGRQDSFLQILHLTQMLIDEGDAFMSDYPTASRGASSGSTAASATADGRRRQWSAPIKNTLKSKAHDYFHSLHAHVWVAFKTKCIETEDVSDGLGAADMRRNKSSACPLGSQAASGHDDVPLVKDWEGARAVRRSAFQSSER